MIWSVNCPSQKIQTGVWTIVYFLGMNSQYLDLSFLTLERTYYVHSGDFTSTKVNTILLYKPPIVAWSRDQINFKGLYLENGSYWDKGPVVKISQFFTLFPTVFSDLSYLEVKIFDLLIGSRDFEHMSRDLPVVFNLASGLKTKIDIPRCVHANLQPLLTKCSVAAKFGA